MSVRFKIKCQYCTIINCLWDDRQGAPLSHLTHPALTLWAAVQYVQYLLCWQPLLSYTVDWINSSGPSPSQQSVHTFIYITITSVGAFISSICIIFWVWKQHECGLFLMWIRSDLNERLVSAYCIINTADMRKQSKTQAESLFSVLLEYWNCQKWKHINK